MNKGQIAASIRRRMKYLSFLGILLASYALYVEMRKEGDSDYQAMCDFSSYISCSKVFTSEYGRGFGFIGKYLGEDHILNQPNSIPGIMFYILIFGLSAIRSPAVAKLQYLLLFLSNFMSVYLGYILYFILHDFCIVCISTYIINFLLTICGHQLNTVVGGPQKKKKKK